MPDESDRYVPLVVPGELGIVARWDGRCKRCHRQWLAPAFIYRSVLDPELGWICVLCAIHERFDLLGEAVQDDAALAATWRNVMERVRVLEELEEKGLLPAADSDEDPYDDGLPKSGLTVADLMPGDLVSRSLGRRAGIVTRVDATEDKVWIRQVSNKDRGYVLEERLCRAEWLFRLDPTHSWTDANTSGDVVPFVDYDGWSRMGRVLDVDGIFLRVRFSLNSGEERELWLDRYVRQTPRSQPSSS